MRIRKRLQRRLALLVMPTYGWGCMIQPCYRASRGDRQLMIVLQSTSEGWMAVAVETKRNAGSVEAVLGDHQHASIVNNEPSYFRACKLVEDYAERWRKGGVGFEACECGPVDVSSARPVAS